MESKCILVCVCILLMAGKNQAKDTNKLVRTSTTPIYSASTDGNHIIALQSYHSNPPSSEVQLAGGSLATWITLKGQKNVDSDLILFSLGATLLILSFLHLRRRKLWRRSKWVITWAYTTMIFLGLMQLTDSIILFESIVHLNSLNELAAAILSIGTAAALGITFSNALEYHEPEELEEIGGESSPKEMKLRRELDTVNLEYSMLLEEMPDGFAHARIITDESGKPIDWEYLNVNQGFENQTGLRKEEVIGKKISEILPEALEDKANWLEIFSKVALTGKPDRVLDHSGPLDRWYDVSLYSPKLGEFAAVFKDATERIKAVDDLRVSEERFRSIFEKAQFGIALVDSDGRPFVVNPQLCDIIGYPEEELMSMTFDQFTHPDDVALDMDNYRQLIANEIDNYTINKRYIGKDGQVRYANLNVSLINDTNDRKYALAVVMDITEGERAKIEKEVADQKAERFDQLFDEMSQVAKIGSWEVDLKTKNMLWSEAVYDIHELPKGKLIKLENTIDFYHHDHRSAIRKGLENGINNNESLDLELMIITAKKRERWVRVIGKPVTSNGKVIKLKGLLQNIDAKKRNELVIEESHKNLEKLIDDRTRELRQANIELESFTYSVSHDLRAPLRAINGFSEALIQDFKDQLTPEASRYLDRISANSIRMGQLIDDLLEFSRMNRKKTKFQSVDVESMAQKIVSEFFSESSDYIEIKELTDVYGDPNMLRQVFINLISNAVKYSSKEEKPYIQLASVRHEDHIILSIKDNGVGFDMTYADKLFKVFQRLHSDSEFEGTGVGLALCHKIMSAHEGDIWAESKTGEGATFYLKFNIRQNE